MSGVRASAAELAQPGKKYTGKQHAGKKPKTRKVTYPGAGRRVNISNVRARLRGTSPAFQRFVVRLLRTQWQQSGGDPACKLASTATVKKWRSDGFAWLPGIGIDAGSYPACAYGSGYFAIAVKVGKKWTAPEALGGQEDPFCTDLGDYRVPKSLVRTSCFPDVGGDPVPYTAASASAPDTQQYAIETLLQTVNTPSPEAAKRFATADVATAMFAERNEFQYAVWSLLRCFDRSDPTYGSSLTVSSYGCLLQTVPPNSTKRWVIQMAPGAFGRWAGVALADVT